jgi:hypothetical protein
MGLSRAMCTYAVWLATSLGALLVFQQSMRRIRVRQAQVIRVWAYSVPMVLPILAVLVAVHIVVAILLAGRWSRWANEEIVFSVALMALVMCPIWSLWRGYRDYLRMRHAFAVAVMSQVIAILATLAIVDIGLGFGMSVIVVQTVGHWLGIWRFPW